MLTRSVLWAALAAAGVAPWPSAQEPADAAPRLPNIVILYADDLGYGDVACQGAAGIPTPNIDRLAAEGLRFTDAHCSAATCTPSRFSLLTGIHGFRHGVRVLPPNAPLTIDTGWLTLPAVLRQAGYATAVIGKWHLGLGARGTAVDWNGEVAPGAIEIGFERAFLMPSTNDRVPCVYLDDHHVRGLDAGDPLYVGKQPPAGFDGTVYPDGRKDPAAMTYYASSHGHNQSVIHGIGRIGYQWGGEAALWNDETMADVFVAEANEWLREQGREKPFFLYFSSQDIHVPRTPHPRFQGRTELGYRGDAIVQLDWAFGAVLDTLDELGLAENTLVICSSDNGPVYDDGYEDGTTVLTSTREVDRGHDGSGPYRGGKYQVYEGGTRVPFIVRWPGRVAAGEVSAALVGQIDLLASLARLVEVEVPADQAIDSRDALGALLGEDREGLPFLVEEGRRLALREGRWKFIRGRGEGKDELYDLGEDVGEQRDLLAAQPERAAAMRARLEVLTAAKGGLRSLR